MIWKCDRYGEEVKYTQCFGEGTRSQRQFQGITSKLEYNIKVYLQYVELEDVGWCNFPRNRDKWRTVVNIEMNIRVR